jgi:glycolate oxidase FAD binding subunit
MTEPAGARKIRECVMAHVKLVVRGSGTKPALSAAGGTAYVLSTIQEFGILEYVPGEFTFTARAGTPLREIEQALAEHGQYMPFEPPLVDQGATLGGAVASGLSGPGRYRYGGIRDFILGVTFVDGKGQLVHGGGKVVKNAAGFDLPKLMVGSLGMFGAMTELTFKVFPKPPGCLTICQEYPGLQPAVDTLFRLLASHIDIDAIELEPKGPVTLGWVRLRGLPTSLAARAEKVRRVAGGGQILDGDCLPTIPFQPVAWRDYSRGFVAKIVVTPARLVEIDRALSNLIPGAYRRYSGGGNQLWLAANAVPTLIGDQLQVLGLEGLIVQGTTDVVRLGVRHGTEFERRIKRALDPEQRFPTY